MLESFMLLFFRTAKDMNYVSYIVQLDMDT